MSYQYYRFFPGDYLRDTQHLTLLQHGAYRLLLDAYMAAGKPLRGDLHSFCRICGALSGEERQAVEFVLAEFFVQEGPAWRNRRCDRELEYLGTLSKAGRDAARKRWNATVMRSHCDGNAIPEPEPEPKELQHTPTGFDRFWSAWPTHKRKANKQGCLGVWKQRHLEPEADRIIAHVLARRATDDWLKDAGQFIPAPIVYLRARQYEAPATVAQPRKVAL